MNDILVILKSGKELLFKTPSTLEDVFNSMSTAEGSVIKADYCFILCSEIAAVIDMTETEAR